MRGAASLRYLPNAIAILFARLRWLPGQVDRIAAIVEIATQASHRTWTQRYLCASRPRVDIIRNGLDHHIVAFAGLQNLGIVKVDAACLGARHCEHTPCRRYGDLKAVVLAVGARRLPAHPERAGRRVARIEADVQRTLRHGQVACSCRHRCLILGDGLHRYVIGAARHEALERSLGGSGRLALALHIQHTLDGIVRRYRDLVVGVQPGRIRRLPQHQERGLVAEPNDELAGRIGLWMKYGWNVDFFFWEGLQECFTTMDSYGVGYGARMCVCV